MNVHILNERDLFAASDSVPDSERHARFSTQIAAPNRAHSMAKAHSDDQPGTIGTLITATLDPYADHMQLRIEGSETKVQSTALSSPSLTLHECASNSVKYGALNDRLGSVDVVW